MDLHFSHCVITHLQYHLRGFLFSTCWRLSFPLLSFGEDWQGTSSRRSGLLCMRRLTILLEHNECTLTCMLNFDWYLTETELLLLSEPTARVSWALWFLTFAEIVFMEQTSSVFDVNPCNTLIYVDCREGGKTNTAMAAACQRLNVSLTQGKIKKPGFYLTRHLLDMHFIIRLK